MAGNKEDRDNFHAETPFPLHLTSLLYEVSTWNCLFALVDK
jgi:hypothetical protein